MRPFFLALCALAGCHRDGGPCADGSWSGWASAEDALQVSVKGNDERGDGSARHPFLTLARAVAEVPYGTAGSIALGPGQFPGNTEVYVKGVAPMTIQGCPTGETEIAGVTQGNDRDQALMLSGPELALRHLSITSNGPGIFVRGAALTLEDVRIHDTRRFALAVRGVASHLTMRDVTIDTVVPAPAHGLAGWGVLIAEATARLERVTITGTRGMGLYQREGRLTATDLTVDGVQDSSPRGAGRRGFGVHVDGAENVILEHCTVRHVAGGGILLADVAYAHLSACTIDGVDQAGEEPGDGLVIARRAPEQPPTAVIEDTTVRGARRMGIVLAGVTATLSGVTAGADNGLSEGGSSIYADPLAVVTGATPIPFDRSELRLFRASGEGSAGIRHRAP